MYPSGRGGAAAEQSDRMVALELFNGRGKSTIAARAPRVDERGRLAPSGKPGRDDARVKDAAATP